MVLSRPGPAQRAQVLDKFVHVAQVRPTPPLRTGPRGPLLLPLQGSGAAASPPPGPALAPRAGPWPCALHIKPALAPPLGPQSGSGRHSS